MNQTLKECLLELADEKYRRFQSKLLPGTENILGVPLPKLRKLAWKIVKGDWRDYLVSAQDDSYEEIMLQGLVIGYAKADRDEILRYVTYFVPKIKNWGICDSFCSGLKIAKEHPSQVWRFLQSYFDSGEEFKIRFAAVMALDFYINDEYIDEVLERLDTVKKDGYYAQMAVAWAVSICFVKFPEKTMKYLRKNNWDDFTYNKALQKITESLCVDGEMKALMRKMKRDDKSGTKTL